MGIDDFMTFCRLLGAEPYIAVNSGFGDAYSAAEEVEYVNGAAASRLGQWRAANGHPAPYGVRIWGIGNEMCGPWQWGHMAVTQYPEKHNLLVKAMRKVDPAIKVIASSATPEELSWTYIENRQLGTFPGRETVAASATVAHSMTGRERCWNVPPTIGYLGSTSTATRTWRLTAKTGVRGG
jgi:alpha-N-arabinofuranosidase